MFFNHRIRIDLLYMRTTCQLQSIGIVKLFLHCQVTSLELLDADSTAAVFLLLDDFLDLVLV